MNVIGVVENSIEMSWALGDPADHPDRIPFLDFTVDGRSLCDRFGGDITALHQLDPDFRTTNLQRLAGHPVPLPSFSPRFHRTPLDRLLRRRGAPFAFVESAFADGRVGLLYCPCGNMDCGVLSTRIEFTPELVAWRDIGWQVTYEPDDPKFQGYLNDPESFAFERAQYDSLMSWLLSADWSASIPVPGGP